MPIWYVFERATGRFAGSGTMEIRNDTHDCTETPILPAPLSEPEPVYDAGTGVWGWRADWAVAGDLPSQGQEVELNGQTWVSQMNGNFWPVGVVGPWLPKPAESVEPWEAGRVYVAPVQVLGDGRIWQLQAGSSPETAAVGREPWQAYMWAVWQEVLP